MFEIKPMRRCRRFVLYFILLFLLSTLATVSHQHDDTADDRDCPICIAIDDQTTAGPLAVDFDGTSLLIETRFVASAPARTDTISLSSHGTRSPPA